MSSKIGLTSAELIADLKSDPEFAAAWEIESVIGTLAANIARLRHERGLTQKELAARAGMRQPHVAKIERGDANLETRSLIRLAVALRVDVHELFLDHRNHRGSVTVKVVWDEDSANTFRHAPWKAQRTTITRSGTAANGNSFDFALAA
jgi:transcriptional regulator with XRE-family HTH domain